MALIEKQGVPTASLVFKGLVKAWQQSAQAFGIAELPIAVLEETFNNAPPAEIERMCDLSIDALVTGVTQTIKQQDLKPSTAKVAAAETVSFEGGDLLEAFTVMNERFLRDEWSDGLLVTPPTPKAVAEMLKHTKRDPHEVIAVLEPSYGMATVERIAINAVMAGCKPEHLPVLIAAVQAISNPRFVLRDAAVSTAGRAPLMLVNGPIAERLHMNSGVCALGPGRRSAVNIAMGRALRLIYINILGVRSGGTDPATIGLPTKFSLCVAENEEKSPWEPYHVEMGCPREASTVTVKTVYGCNETRDTKAPTPERLVDVAVSAAKCFGTSFGGWLAGGSTDPDKGVEVTEQHMWLICPDHAAKLAAAGWSKNDVRNYLWKKSTIAFREIAERNVISKDAQGKWVRHPEMQWMEGKPETEVPMYTGPESFRLAVVGGPGPRGVFFWGNEEAVTQQIEE